MKTFKTIIFDVASVAPHQIEEMICTLGINPDNIILVEVVNAKPLIKYSLCVSSEENTDKLKYKLLIRYIFRLINQS